MEKRIIVCDVCKAEVESNAYEPQGFRRIVLDYGVTSSHKKTYHICDDCLRVKFKFEEKLIKETYPNETLADRLFNVMQEVIQENMEQWNA